MSRCGLISGRIFVFCWHRAAAVWERCLGASKFGAVVELEWGCRSQFGKIVSVDMAIHSFWINFAKSIW